MCRWVVGIKACTTNEIEGRLIKETSGTDYHGKVNTEECVFHVLDLQVRHNQVSVVITSG